MMKQGICLIAHAALRSAPEHRSEMVSQLIFGELFKVLQAQKDWYLIQVHHDLYQAWVAANQVQLIGESEYDRLAALPPCVSISPSASLTNLTAETTQVISPGSSLPFIHDPDEKLAGQSFSFAGEYHMPSGPPDPATLLRFARLFAETPYLWGGRSSCGMDCSGFVQMVYKMAGLNIPRDAAMQAREGEVIHLIHEARPGDLMFFDDPEEVITHVGLYAGNAMICHAHGMVRTDMVDHQGIFNSEQKRYTHRLRIIKRYLLP